MKRSPILIELSREHHTALVLALHIARANDPVALQKLLTDVPAIFRDDLEPHFQDEEQGVLPRLANAGELSLVNRTLDEHQQMRDLVVKIAAGDLPSLKAFGAMLKAHVQFEERELFATAEAVLPPSYLDQHV